MRVGCAALRRVVIENDTYEDVTVVKVGDFLVDVVPLFVLARTLVWRSVKC